MTSPEQVAAGVIDEFYRNELIPASTYNEAGECVDSPTARAVVTALRDAGYLIEGGETRDEQFGVEWSGDVSPKVDWPYDADEVANQRDWKDPGHADTRIVKRTRIVGPWRPVEEETNDD